MPGYTSGAQTPYYVDADVPDIGAATFGLAWAIEKKLVPNFASTGTRDLAITGVSTGVNPPGPTVGQIVTIGTGTGVQAQMWDGTAWQPMAMVLPFCDASGGGSASTNTPATATWAVLPISQTDFSGGTGISRTSTTQLTVTTAGRYVIIIEAAWGPNATGRRILGYCLNGATDPGVDFKVETETVPTQAWNQIYTNEISLAAGDMVAPFAYQDSGSLIVVGQRRLMLRRVA